jgi:hypothetical protein
MALRPVAVIKASSVRSFGESIRDHDTDLLDGGRWMRERLREPRAIKAPPRTLVHFLYRITKEISTVRV